MKLAKLVPYFFIIHIGPNLRSNFGNHTHLECLSKIFGLSGGVMEILTLIGVQKCKFVANQKNEQILMPFLQAN